MKNIVLAAALASLATAGFAAPEKFSLDPSHSQVVFKYNHLGFSTTYGMFSGFEGQIMMDQENPANSSVNVSIPVMTMLTGWQDRETHFMSGDFFGAKEGDMITFASTMVEVTGENTAKITGDLTMNGVTKPVVLDAKLNQAGTHPMANQPWAGFDATTSVVRSDFNLGMFAPYVGDEVQLMISVEAMKVE